MTKPLAILLAAAVAMSFSVAGAVPATAAVGIASKAPCSFDIPEGPLAVALSRFSEQTGIQVFYQPQAVEGRLAKRLARSMTPIEALNSLIQEAGLRWEEVDATTVVLKRIGIASPLSAAPGRRSVNDSAERGGSEEVVVVGDAWREARRPNYDANVDLLRTMDDAQAYYIFDSSALARSAAVNIEDFMRQQLTMNSVAQTMSQTDSRGSSSRIDLRGLGTDKTLILINGRRAPGPLDYDSEYQPDLNAIPLSAIDRIEVLPSSASGIYGGGAIGGVVNVILKKNFDGGVVRADYHNTFDGDLAQPALSATYGGTLGKTGKTSYMVSGAWSHSDTLVSHRRRDVVTRNVNRILANSPSYFHSTTHPYLGATPNITSVDGSNLTLRDGTSLNAPITHVPAGAAPGMSFAELAAPLVANAGTFNMALTDSSQQSGNALGRMLIKGARVHSVLGSLRHQLTERIDAYADFSYAKNEASTVINQPGAWPLEVPASSPINPFAEDVYVSFPNSLDPEISTYDNSRRVSTGLLFEGPNDWVGAIDVTYTRALHRSTWFGADWTGLAAALASGAYNPFVDTRAYTQNLPDYLSTIIQPSREGTTSAYTLRGSGPVFDLPWGRPVLALGLELICNQQGQATGRTLYPQTPSETNSFTYFKQSQRSYSLYAETTVPLLRAATHRFAKSLELQLAVRRERYDVDAGTYRDTNYYLREEPYIRYSPADENGHPYRLGTRFEQTSPTVALKYEVSPTLMFRTSLSNAYLPPTYSQLLPSVVPEEQTTHILDQATGTEYEVFTLAGGASGMRPTRSQSFNAGVVIAPQRSALAGLRLSVEYFRVRQTDVIGYLSAQYLINNEARFPERVQRDPQTGRITLVNAQASNLTRYETRGWDFNVGYSRVSGAHSFDANLLATLVEAERRQLEPDGPMLDFAGYVNEGGPLRVRANLNLSWSYRGWQANWNTAYYDSYFQFGAAGGPDYMQFAASYGPTTYYTAAQGGDEIASQVYHDVMLGYSFDKHGWLGETSAKLSIRNVFDKTPPFDAYNSYGYYSTFGDIRLRSYMLSMQRRF